MSTGDKLVLIKAKPATLAPAYDTPSGLAGHAAHKLVHFRDGIMRSLLREAELTAYETPMDAADILAALLEGLEREDRDRRALQITHIAGQCWGFFPDIGVEREHALATLRAVCKDAANAVLHDVQAAASACRNATKEKIR